MGSVYKPLLYGPRTPEYVLWVLEDWIDWHAYRLASDAPGPVDNLYYQDLAQEGRLAVCRLLERDPSIWAPKLLRLAVLAMYAARRRGRSVLRADPSHRRRIYEQVPLDLMEDEMIVGDANDGDEVDAEGCSGFGDEYDDVAHDERWEDER